MSLRVLVIPEDGRHNGFILKPLVERILAECGKSNAKVRVLTDPRLGGYESARQIIRARFREKRMDDLWLFLPDADKATGLEELRQEAATAGINLICCAAKPEVEAWLLAGHRQQLSVPWSTVISHPRLKEDVFAPFIATHGNAAQPGGGRETLMRESLANYRGLLSVCPELSELEGKIRRMLSKFP